MSTATLPRATGYPVPASGAALNSEPVRTQLVNIVDFLEGGNIAQGNVDVTEIATLATANTWTANQTITATLTVGVDDTGYDVRFYGATTGKSMLWDESADTLIVTGAQTVSETLGVTGVATFTAQSVHTGGMQSGGNIVSDTDSTDDLGTNAVRWANLYVDDITLTTTLTAGTSVVAGTMTVASGSITDSSGAISFGNENLSTTGTLSAGATTVTSLNASDGNITNVGDIALDTISSDAGTTITISLGTDAGDDFIIGSNLFVFEGDKGQAVITPSSASNYGVDIVQSQSEATQGNLAHYDYGSAGAAVKGRTKTSISTTPTVIANPIGRGGMWLVTGNDSTNYFLDLVWYADNVTPAVIQSLTAAGSPATRTYSNTSNQMYLAMSTGTYTINAFGIGVEDPA